MKKRCTFIIYRCRVKKIIEFYLEKLNRHLVLTKVA